MILCEKWQHLGSCLSECGDYWHFMYKRQKLGFGLLGLGAGGILFIPVSNEPSAVLARAFGECREG